MREQSIFNGIIHILCMLPNNSMRVQTQKKQTKAFQKENDDFEKVVKFIQWSEQENELLFKFEHLLSKLIKITKDELNILIAPLKIDHQLTKYLAKTVEEIDQNLSLFFQSSFDDYQSRIQSKGLTKVNLLMKTSSEQTKCVCYTIIFLHFASSNMSQYNKIIHWWEKKEMHKKLEEYKQQRSCIIKQKALTIISALYIKHNNISSKSQLVQIAIKQRQKYLKFEQQYHRHRSYRNNRKQSLFLINNLDLSNASSSKISSEVNSVKKMKSGEQISLYNSVTNYLRVKLVQALIYQLSLNKQLSQPLSMNCYKQKSTQPELIKLYYVQTLINKFVNEVKTKNIESQSSTYFFQKMKELENICLQNIKHMELNVTDSYCCDQNSKIKPFQMIKKIKIADKSENAKKRILSLNVQHRSLTKSKVSDQLNELFFKANNKQDKERNKIKSAKVLVRERSKSKIMAKILSNTFQNAKNALRRIQFEMKSNNYDRIDSKSTKIEKEKLRKRRKTKNQIYEMFSQNKRILSNICKQNLIEQLKKMKNISINNPLKTIEDNKKCIIQHKILHKDYQQSQLTEGSKTSDQSLLSTEVFQKLKFIKIIEKIPHEVGVKIKPMEKNYVLKFYFKPFDEQQFTIQISLPRSNNVYTKRSQTIWPTIKYLFRKKLLQFPIFRQNQSKLCDIKTANQQEKNHNIITEQKLVGLFGAINEDQFNDICITLGLFCKFSYMLLSSQLSIFGRRYQFCLINSDLEEKKSYNSIKPEQVNEVKSFSEIKQLIWMNNRANILLGTNIIKQTGCKINIFEDFLEQPYYILSQSINISKIVKKRIPTQLIFYIKVFYIGRPSGQIQRNKKKYKKSPSFVYQAQINISAVEVEKYNIDFQKLIQNVKKAIFGYKIDKIIREKLQQLCWRYFQKAKQFYLPSFFYYTFPEISEPEKNNVFCENIQTEIDQLDQNWFKPETKIKVCENVLEFSLDYMQNKTVSIQNYQQKVINQIQFTRTWQSKRKVSKVKNKKKIQSKGLFSQKELKTYEKLNIQKQLDNKNNHIKFSLRYFDGKYKKILVQVKFLTPFYPIYNWISEISMIDINSKRKKKIRFSAFDLYSLGFPILQSPLQTLKEIQKLSKCIKVNRNRLIHKLIFAIDQSEPINTSIEKLSKVNHFCIDDSSYDKENKETIYKFTSVYPNRKNKKVSYHDKPYFQTSGSLSDHRTQIFAQLNKNYNKQKNASKQENPSKVSTVSIQNQSGNFFLTRLQQYQWFLWTLPYKFSIKDLRKNNTKIFSLISLKYLHLQSQKKSKYGGIVQIEVRFSQVEYSLVAQIEQKEFYNTVSDIVPNMSLIMKKVKLFNRIEIQNSQQQLINQKEQKNKARRFSTKNKQKNKLQKINFTLLNCQSHHYSQRFSRTVFNQNHIIDQRSSFALTFQDKEEFKKIIKSCSIKKNTLNVNENQNDEHQNCALSSRHLFENCSTYKLEIQNNYFPMKVKLIREYDPNKLCIYDVYMYLKNWEVGTEFNSGIGLGAEIGIQRIDEEDCFQIVKMENKKQQNLKEISCEVIQNQKILDLIKEYKLDQVDTISQMQPEFYTKTTILLIQLAQYFFNNCVKKAKKSRKIQV